MKSERRHELQHNELADWIIKLNETIKPYANVLIGGVLLIAIIAVGWTVMAKKSSAEAKSACEDFYVALQHSSYAELDNVVTRYPGSKAAHWARVVDGDLRLAEGCSERFTSRAGANQELNKAIEDYDAVLAGCKDKEIRQRAYFGLARANETLGDLDKAVDYYKKLLKPENAYTQAAEARIKALESPATKRFYDKFAKFDPKPVFQEDLPGPLELDKLDNLKMPGPNESLFPKYDPMFPENGPDTSTGGTTSGDSTADDNKPAESTSPATDDSAATPKAKETEPAPKED